MFRDAIGHMFRCGRDVFVRNAFEWKVGGRWHYGEAPARLQRLFHFDDDDEEEGEKRLMVEHNWCHRASPAPLAVTSVTISCDLTAFVPVRACAGPCTWS